jgi:hypothetical protein
MGNPLLDNSRNNERTEIFDDALKRPTLSHISYSELKLTKGNETYGTVVLYLLLDMLLNLVKRGESRESDLISGSLESHPEKKFIR